jgi:YHS domain-containing protein
MLLRWALIAFLLLLLVRAIGRLVAGLLEGAGYTREPSGAGRSSTVHLVRDPVCGVHVVPSKSLSVGTGDARQYFCSARCRDRYLAEQKSA